MPRFLSRSCLVSTKTCLTLACLVFGACQNEAGVSENEAAAASYFLKANASSWAARAVGGLELGTPAPRLLWNGLARASRG